MRIWRRSSPPSPSRPFLKIPTPASLKVSAMTPDGDALTYNWTVQSGIGTFPQSPRRQSDLHPGDVTEVRTCILKVEVSDGTHIVSRTMPLKVVDMDAGRLPEATILPTGI